MGRTASLGNSNLEEPPGEFRTYYYYYLSVGTGWLQRKGNYIQIFKNIYINKSTLRTDLIIITILRFFEEIFEKIIFGDSLQNFKEPMHNSGQH